MRECGGGEGSVGEGGGDDCGVRGREDGNKDLRAHEFLLWSKESGTESVAV